MRSPLVSFLLLGSSASDAPVKPKRDLRIDLVRGLALMIIFINHMPGNIVAAVTPHAYGFSDAAEAFVLLSGISAALAFGRVMDSQGFAAGAVKVAARVRTLYVAHLAVFLAVVALVALAVEYTENPLYIETINITPVLADPLKALSHVLGMTYQPNYLDILPLYVVFLAVFPLLHLAVKRSPLLTLAASVVLWRFAATTGLSLPNGNGSWTFNPFAWQVLFTLGVVIGQAMRAGVTLPRSAGLRLADIAAVGMLLFSAIVMLAPVNPFAFLGQAVADLSLGTDKNHLAPVRLLHVLALAWLFVRLVPAEAAFLKHKLTQSLTRAGSHSLEVFCAGTVLAILGQVIIVETAYHIIVQLLVVGVGVSILISLGNLLTWSKTLSTSDAPRATSSAVTASASRSPSSA